MAFTVYPAPEAVHGLQGHVEWRLCLSRSVGWRGPRARGQRGLWAPPAVPRLARPRAGPNLIGRLCAAALQLLCDRCGPSLCIWLLAAVGWQIAQAHGRRHFVMLQLQGPHLSLRPCVHVSSCCPCLQLGLMFARLGADSGQLCSGQGHRWWRTGSPRARICCLDVSSWERAQLSPSGIAADLAERACSQYG